jgi:hypothetical protein
MREILKVDYNGVRIQYQGDNMIGVIHLPADDDEKIATGVADIAAGMQSSMSVTLPEVVPDATRLDVAVGVAMDDTVIACLGQFAKRNALVLGPAATEAEKIQMRLDGKQTGIDATTHEALPEAVQQLYEWNANAKAYVAEDLSTAKLSRVREAFTSNGQRTLTPNDRGRLEIGTSAAVTEKTRRVRPFRPYAE